MSSTLLEKCPVCGYDELLTDGICGVCKGHVEGTHAHSNTACRLCMARSTEEIIKRNKAIAEATPRGRRTSNLTERSPEDDQTTTIRH